jgi:type I restriction enzyme R subunit
MIQVNKTRADYEERLQKLIDDYNSGAVTMEHYFRALVEMAQDLTAEEQRTISEGLSEEELAVFDLLTKPEMSLTEEEKKEVKKVARDLLWTLKKEKLVLDWRKRQQARAAVRLAVEEELDRLPETYSDQIFWSKVDSHPVQSSLDYHRG